MPRPYAGEKQKNFIPRCIKVVRGEGKYSNKAQIAAICYSLWKGRSKDSCQNFRLVKVRSA